MKLKNNVWEKLDNYFSENVTTEELKKFSVPLIKMIDELHELYTGDSCKQKLDKIKLLVKAHTHYRGLRTLHLISKVVDVEL